MCVCVCVCAGIGAIITIFRYCAVFRNSGRGYAVFVTISGTAEPYLVVFGIRDQPAGLVLWFGEIPDFGGN